MTQDELRYISLDTLKILKEHKTCVNGYELDISTDLINSVKNTEFCPNGCRFIKVGNHNPNCSFSVLNMSTTDCIEYMNSLGLKNVVVLNFASATKAGGGWLNGRMAQEEDITRKSSLFLSIANQTSFYKSHSEDFPLYSNALIYSPNVLLLKNKDYETIDPIEFACITSPAVNVRAIENNPKWKPLFDTTFGRDFIYQVMSERISNILDLAILKGHKNIILGAFGCGVFQNNPQDIAEIFFKHFKKGKYENYFKNVCFAILDNSPTKENFSAFDNYFS